MVENGTKKTMRKKKKKKSKENKGKKKKEKKKKELAHDEVVASLPLAPAVRYDLIG